jgi:hypothetical protein
VIDSFIKSKKPIFPWKQRDFKIATNPKNTNSFEKMEKIENQLSAAEYPILSLSNFRKNQTF